MHHGVARDQSAEGVVLILSRQLAVQEQIAGLHEGAMLGKLIDGIAAIESTPFPPSMKVIFDSQLAVEVDARIVSEVVARHKRGDVDQSGPSVPLRTGSHGAPPATANDASGATVLLDIAF